MRKQRKSNPAEEIKKELRGGIEVTRCTVRIPVDTAEKLDKIIEVGKMGISRNTLIMKYVEYCLQNNIMPQTCMVEITQQK